MVKRRFKRRTCKSSAVLPTSGVHAPRCGQSSMAVMRNPERAWALFSEAIPFRPASAARTARAFRYAVAPAPHNPRPLVSIEGVGTTVSESFRSTTPVSHTLWRRNTGRRNLRHIFPLPKGLRDLESRERSQKGKARLPKTKKGYGTRSLDPPALPATTPQSADRGLEVTDAARGEQ